MASIINQTGNASLGGRISTVTTNAGMGQRETLEAILITLADALSINQVHKRLSNRDATFYSFTGPRGTYQSATNTILEMAQLIRDKP